MNVIAGGPHDDRAFAQHGFHMRPGMVPAVYEERLVLHDGEGGVLGIQVLDDLAGIIELRVEQRQCSSAAIESIDAIVVLPGAGSQMSSTKPFLFSAQEESDSPEAISK